MNKLMVQSSIKFRGKLMMSQGSPDITGYYTKLKKLWEKLNTLNVTAQWSCTCICGAKAPAHKAEHDRRLIQFLMGLNDVYIVILIV